MRTLTEIDDALLARIRAQLPYLATVDSYQGELQKWLEEGLILRFPAVLVALNADEAEPVAKASRSSYAFDLLILCRDLRGEQAARKGEEGVYRILHDLKAALAGYRLFADFTAVQFQKTTVLFVTPELTAYAATVGFKEQTTYP